ncbi:hypothetical protein B0H11DRAFT_1379899 [Mycena galericulata]|nr:hypothetical protein B0H11DRAFT_1379899 [Mycena galericulata]
MSSGPPPPYEVADCSYSEAPRYVYYCVYATDGMLRCKNGANPFIARIKATSVPPPHTVASLKRALVKAEELPDPSERLTCLFKTRDARKAMAKGARVDILTGELGATPQRPVALVFLSDPEETLGVSDKDGASSNDELPTLYYRLYNHAGEEHSVRAFDRREPSLGRINRDSIAPPRNALCVKRRIARVEGEPMYKLADLFTDTKTDDPHSSTAVVDDTHGSSKYGTNSARWLSPSPGDTLLTDGVEQSMVSMSMPGVGQVYMAVDKSGKTGCGSVIYILFVD